MGIFDKADGKKLYAIGILTLMVAVAYNRDLISATQWEQILTALGGAAVIGLKSALSKLEK